jgi:hypothetical protein
MSRELGAPARLAIFGVGLAAVFGGALLLGGAVVPDALVEDWIGAVTPQQAPEHQTPGHVTPGSEHSEE